MSGSQQLLLGGVPASGAVDPYFYSVTSLLHGDGTNGAQNNTFLDSSTNNFTITRNGNTTQGSFSPFSQTGWSNYFDGGTATRLTFPSNTAFAFGTGAYTVEAWVYLNAHAASQSTVFEAGSASGALSISVLSTGALSLGTYGVGALINSPASVVSLNQWNHVAVVRSSTASNDTKFYVNGTLVTTGTDSSNWTVTTTPATGGLNISGYTLNGYVSNLRVVKGTAVYTSNFTVPTTPLTAITNTSLLTCQANRFLDASTNAFAVTASGSPSVQPFSPFNPTTAYSTSVVGGSGYFDGSGDYLTAASNAAFALSGDFSMECWAYFNGATAVGGGPSGEMLFASNAVGGAVMCVASGTSINLSATSTAIDLSASYTFTPGQWYHLVIARTGTTGVIYVNGTRVASGTVTRSYTQGQFSTQSGFNGYMMDVRIVKGSNPYGTGTTITVPTAPLTAIANTSILLSCTNAGIFDNAAVADYETVGNAQISTSVKKYGTGSMYFDGTGDWLFAPSSTQFGFGTGDFTVECWVYTASFSAVQAIVDARPSNSATPWALSISATGLARTYDGSTVRTGGQLTASAWNHVAWNRTAGVNNVYVNGTLGHTWSASTDFGTSRPLTVGAGAASSGETLTGYIDDLRISKGVGRYPYNFTPPTAELPNIGGPFPTLTADPYFDYTTLLLPGNGTNGAQNNTFLDSSTNNFTITRNGNTTQGTFSPFSQTGWSNYFDGTGDYLTLPSSANLATGSSNFTIECWVYFVTATTTVQYIFSGSGATIQTLATGELITFDGSGNYSFGILPTNQWCHIAVCRSGTTIKTFLNGTQTASWTNSGTIYTHSSGRIGAAISTGANPFGGYISNYRLVVGTALYTAAFTPPTLPLTAVTNTQLLICQANRFLDASTNNFAITVSGDTSIQAFSPFNPTAAWSAATNGGSGYFDGSGDNVTAPANTAFAFGKGDLTVEMWIYPVSTITTPANIGLFYIEQTNGLVVGLSNGYLALGSRAVGYEITSSYIPPLNAWTHVAVTRSGATAYIFANGVQVGTVTSSGGNPANNADYVCTTGLPTVAGNYAGGAGFGYFPGYISGLRVLKGTAQYTAAFTPPTAPPTNITNTSILLNYTNAGIYDATSKNDLETVSNAQISTTQSKFGGSSMYFDGNDDVLTTFQQKEYYAQRGDFTIECWVYPTNPANGTYQYFGSAEGNPYFQIGLASNGKFVFAKGYFGDLVQSVSAATANTWYHVAITRYGSTCTLWVNGVSQGTATDSSACTITGTNPYSVGALWSGGSILYEFSGYMNGFRYTRGIARYTSNFTPPTTAFLTL